MDKKTGGPAFPSTVRREEKYMDEGGYGHTRTVSTLEGGMTLRDWFAGQALAGLTNVAFTYFTGSSEAEKDGAQKFAKEIGKTAYTIADAMLSERDK